MSLDFLPLSADPSSRLSALFSHLWSPVDARLLSTHTLPNQQSAFQVFLQSACDCVLLLAGRAVKNDEQEVTRWLVNTQLGERGWKGCVLVFGGRSGRRRGVQPETEAKIYVQAIVRLRSSSKGLMDDALSFGLEALQGAIVDEAKEGSSKLLARANGILQVFLNEMAADKATLVTSAMDRILGRCVDELDNQSTVIEDILSFIILILREERFVVSPAIQGVSRSPFRLKSQLMLL